MTSLQTSIKQLPSEGSYFIVLPGATANTGILYYTPDSDASKVGSFAPVANTATTWADERPSIFSTVTLRAISTTGAILRDMGKTIVSSGQLFRKVQYIGSNGTESNDTAGVRGPADSTTASGFYTFYIRLGINNGAPTGLPVARV